MKRLFGFALVLALCLGLFAANVYAGGEDTVTVDPVLVDGEVIDVSTSAPVTMSAALDDEGFVALKSGNYEDWIDRLDLTDVAYASELYDWLVKQLSQDSSGALASPEYVYNESIDNEYNQKYYGVTLLGTGNYAHPITSFNGSLTVYYAEGTNDAETEANIKAAVSQAVDAAVESQVDTVSAHAAAVYYAFNRDQMWAFWLSGQMQCGYSYGYSYSASGGVAQVSYTNNIYFYLLTPSFDIRAEGYRENAEHSYNDAVALDVTTLENSVDYITYNIPDDADTYDKVELFHDWLTKNNHYNLSDDLNAIDHHCRTAFGAIGGYDPVCEGYARAFKMMCDWEDIPCVLVDGTVNGGGHMWNYVQMDDGKWYAVDVTWDDPVVSGITSDLSGYERHDYFLVGADTLIDGVSFISSHPVSNKPSGSAPAFINGPVLNSTQYGIIASGDCGDDLTWKLTADGTLTISGTGKMNAYTSTSPAPWAEYADKITALSIGEGVTSIGAYAFANCTALTKVIIPANITSMGNYAFSKCTGLKFIKFEGNSPVKGYPQTYCFSGVTATAVYPANNNSWNYVTYYYGGTISWVAGDGGVGEDGLVWSYDFNEKTLTISGNGEVYNYSSSELAPWAVYSDEIESLVISNGVTTVGNYAFYYCTALKSVSLPNSVTKIGTYGMGFCESLEELILPSGVTSIGWGAFQTCKNLSMVVLPDTLTSIDGRAFLGCSSLESITIPKNVRSISRDAFDYCDALTTIVFEGCPTTIDSDAFTDVTATCYYPSSNSSWTSSKRANYGGTLTWVSYSSTGWSGSGTSSSPYIIVTETQLRLLATRVNAGTSYSGKYFKLGADIPLTQTWTPIGTSTTSFCGTFDGNGHTINGMTTEGDYSALFAYVGAGATIKNVELTDFYVSGHDYLAGLVAYANAGSGSITIANCYVSGETNDETTDNIDSDDFEVSKYLGGIVAYANAQNGSVTISNCSSNGLYECDDYAGGIIGYGKGTNQSLEIINCTNYAIIAANRNSDRCGGIAGELSYAAVESCMNYGDVWGNAYSEDDGSMSLGGIAGVASNTYFYGCGNYGDVDTFFVGGICGGYYSSYCTFEGCFSMGKLTHSSDTTGYGIAPSGNTITNCYYLKDQYISSGGATAVTNAQLASGEIAWLLSSYFGQEIGVDSHPVPLTSTNRVYRLHITGAISADVYVTTGKTAKLPVPSSCMTYTSGSTTFTESTVVTKDYNLSAAGPYHNYVGGVCTKCEATVENYLDGGSIGENISWYVTTDGELVITGNGAMPDYSAENPAPWSAYADDITEVSIGSGITAIGDGAFTDFGELAEITIPESVTAVGENAFNGCSGLEDVYYDGEMSQWYAIVIESGNEELLGAEVHFTFYDSHSGYKALSSNSSGQLLVDGVAASTDYYGKYILPDGYYYLTDNVRINNEIYISSGDDITICLNGYVLSYIGEDSHSVFNVNHGNLTLIDCGNRTHKFKVSDSGQWLLDEASGSKTVTGGVITGGYNTGSGGAISVNSGHVYLKNVNLVGNYGRHGGGVYVDKGEYHMDGGSILGNESFHAGGVYCGYDESYNPSIVDIKNADISYNCSEYYAGAMYVNGKNVSIRDTDITNNECGETGGIRINYGAKIVFAGDCSVTGNIGSVSTETYSGGGINLRGSMEVSGKLVVDGNYCDDVEENIRVWFDGTLIVGESFSSESSIGITAGGDVPCVITSNGGAAYASCFTSDDDAYRIITDSGEVVIEKAGYTVSGKISSYGKPVTSGTVYLMNGNDEVASTTTDANGVYSFENVEAGIYTVKVAKDHYLSRTAETKLENVDITLDLIIYLKGDVNMDGEVNILDHQRLFEHLQEIELISGMDQLAIADVNGDGEINILDHQRLFEHLQEIELLV